MAGAFEQAVAALRIFKESRIGTRPRVSVMFTLLNDNLDDLPVLAQLAESLDCSMRVQPYSMLKTGETELIHPRPVARKLLALCRRYPSIVTNPVVLEKFDLAIGEGVPDCVAGLRMLNIDPFGSVSICPESQANPIGHILSDDIDVLLARLRREHDANSCTACWYNCRNEMEVCYSFRGFFYGMMRNLFGRRLRRN